MPPKVTMSWFEGLLEESALMPKTFLTWLERPESLRMLGKQGTQRMKKPQVISAQAQKRSGAMKYMVSFSWAKVTVVAKRMLPEMDALRRCVSHGGIRSDRIGARTNSKPTPKMSEIPIFFCQFICSPQMIFCGSKIMLQSVATWTHADVSITLLRS